MNKTQIRIFVDDSGNYNRYWCPRYTLLKQLKNHVNRKYNKIIKV